MRRTAWLSAAAALPLFAGVAFGQDAKDLELASLLNQKVVSASRFAQRIGDAPSPVTVITDEDIQRMGAQDLGEVLRMVPGLNLRARAKGSYILSARNEFLVVDAKVLVLVDGRQTAYPVHYVTLWETMPVTLDQIERIEVVRGPGSTLYGANAYDAVINILTRRPAGGTHATATVSAADGEQQLGATYRQSMGAFRVDGFIESDRADPGQAFNPVAGAPPIEHDHRLAKGGARLGWSTVSGLDVEGFAGLTQGTLAEWWTYFNPFGTFDFDGRYAGVAISDGHLPGDVALRSHYSYSWNDDRGMLPGTSSPFASSTHDAQLTLDRAVGAHHLLLGGSLRRNYGGSVETLIATGHAQMLYGAYVQDSWAVVPHVQLVAGARYDADPDRAGAFSPRASLLVQPSAAHTLRLSAARAFRMSTLMEAFMDLQMPTPMPGLVVTYVGNDSLKPEQITSFEAGYIGALAPGLDVEADVFYNRHDNRILFAPVATLPLPTGGSIAVRSEYRNLPGGIARGGELIVRYTPSERVRAQANYAYTLREDSAGLALGTPGHKLNAEIGGSPARPLWLDLTANYASDVDLTSQIYGPVADVIGTTAKARWIIDLNARLQLGHGLSASAFVLNLPNWTYSDLPGGELFHRRIVVKAAARL